MPSRRDNRVCTRRLNNSQQAEDVTEVGSNQPNSGQGMPSRRDNRVSTRGRNSSQQAEDVTEVGSNQPNNDEGMPSRGGNRVNTRGRNNSQQAEDVTEVGSNQPNNSQVPGNARKRFNEYGQPVDETTSTLTHFIGSLARSEKYCKLHKPWNKVKNAKKQILLDTVNWKRLVKYWNKGKSKRLSDKNKANRAKKKMMQVTGKKSYAQVREKLKVILGREPTRKELFRACFSKDRITKNEEAANAIEQMDELTSQLSEHELDEPGPQDIYSKVMGNDKNGTAEMYGLGVHASDVWGVVPSRSARRRDKLQWKSTAEQLSIELAEYKVREAQRQGSSDNDSYGVNVPHTSPQGLIVANEPRHFTIQDDIGTPVAWPCSLVSVCYPVVREDD
ncbi:transposase, Ptta/En/Spm [Tanacetum coccineum]